MMARICSITDVPTGQVRRFELGNLVVAIANVDGHWYAIADTCSHQNVSLADGELQTATLELECPKHGSCFSLETGIPSSLPATKAVPVYLVRLDGDDVYLEVAE